MARTRPAHPALTPSRIAALSRMAAALDRDERAEIKAKGRVAFARHESVRALITALKQARLDRGLTLADVGERSGIGKANVSRLENDPSPNPTWDTLTRYADAVGLKLQALLA